MSWFQLGKEDARSALDHAEMVGEEIKRDDIHPSIDHEGASKEQIDAYMAGWRWVMEETPGGCGVHGYHPSDDWLKD